LPREDVWRDCAERRRPVKAALPGATA
jgi:hypothetical protein